MKGGHAGATKMAADLNGILQEFEEPGWIVPEASGTQIGCTLAQGALERQVGVAIGAAEI